MTPITFLLFVAGLALLILGAEILVRGASRLATAAGVSPLVIGLTVVAFGTSSPELAVSVQSSWTGRADVALGNVVGSNIFNVLFILGIAAIVAPLVVAQQLVRWDVPLLIGVSMLCWLLGSDGLIGRVDGAILFTGIIAYTGFAIRQSRRETAAVRAEYDQEFGGRPASQGKFITQALMILIGVGMLVLGSHWLVQGAVAVARAAGLSELIVGLTIVAAGTSLPEVATSVLASVRGERDIAVGNAIGSNLFNILSVLGLSALVSPAGIRVPEAALGFDIPVMIAVAVACLPILYTGYVIARWEGIMFLAYYVAYAAYLIADAQGHDKLPLFNAIMLWFVLPLTAVTLLVLAVRTWRSRGSRVLSTRSVEDG